jgi:hypothetical protein
MPKKERLQVRRLAAIAGAWIAVGAGATSCVLDFTPTPTSSATSPDCAHDWQTHEASNPDAGWFGCRTAYCFAGRSYLGDHCPSGWGTVGFLVGCPSACTVDLPCAATFFGPTQCCDPACESRMRDDAGDSSPRGTGDEDASGDADAAEDREGSAPDAGVDGN